MDANAPTAPMIMRPLIYICFVISGSYSSSHSQDASPYNAVSLASSPQSSNSFPDLYNTNVGGFVNQRSPQDMVILVVEFTFE